MIRSRSEPAAGYRHRMDRHRRQGATAPAERATAAEGVVGPAPALLRLGAIRFGLWPRLTPRAGLGLLTIIIRSGRVPARASPVIVPWHARRKTPVVSPYRAYRWRNRRSAPNRTRKALRRLLIRRAQRLCKSYRMADRTAGRQVIHSRLAFQTDLTLTDRSEGVPANPANRVPGHAGTQCDAGRLSAEESFFRPDAIRCRTHD